MSKYLSEDNGSIKFKGLLKYQQIYNNGFEEVKLIIATFCDKRWHFYSNYSPSVKSKIKSLLFKKINSLFPVGKVTITYIINFNTHFAKIVIQLYKQK